MFDVVVVGQTFIKKDILYHNTEIEVSVICCLVRTMTIWRNVNLSGVKFTFSGTNKTVFS